MNLKNRERIKENGYDKEDCLVDALHYLLSAISDGPTHHPTI